MANAITMNGLLGCEYFDIHSDVVDDSFRIFVARPSAAGSERYPAILLADGNGGFPMAMGIQRMLSWGGEVPPAYIIGLGYPTESGFLEAISKRNRDYVPPETAEIAKALLLDNVSDGAANFLEFIRKELNPRLERDYAIDLENLAFCGSSLAGLFGAWVLLTRPDTFNRYVLASPAIALAGNRFADWEAQFSKQKIARRTSVYIGAGSLETADAARSNALEVSARNALLRPTIEKMIAGLDERGWHSTVGMATDFGERLAALHRCDLSIRHETLLEETHMSVTAAVMSRGMRTVFGD